MREGILFAVAIFKTPASGLFETMSLTAALLSTACLIPNLSPLRGEGGVEAKYSIIFSALEPAPEANIAILCIVFFERHKVVTFQNEKIDFIFFISYSIRQCHSTTEL